MQQGHDRDRRRQRYLLALIEATYPLQQEGAADPEVTLELLIEAAAELHGHLQRELEELRLEQAE